jgi:hypothetical protein
MASKGDPDRAERPDIELGAVVRAKRLRFNSVPETQGSASEREGLPDRVEPGVTYRDVRVRWRAAARIR